MDRFEQRLTLNNPRLVECDLESKLLLRIRFFIDGADKEFEACFQRETGIVRGRIEENVHRLQGVDGFGRKPTVAPTANVPGHVLTDVYSCGLSTNREQQAVLLDVVQSVEHPERVIPTFVWCERVERIETLYADGLATKEQDAVLSRQ